MLQPKIIEAIKFLDNKLLVSKQVCRLLDVDIGDSIMFVNNLNAIQQAELDRFLDVDAICKAEGIDLDKEHGKLAFEDLFKQFAIAKYIQSITEDGDLIVDNSKCDILSSYDDDWFIVDNLYIYDKLKDYSTYSTFEKSNFFVCLKSGIQFIKTKIIPLI